MKIADQMRRGKKKDSRIQEFKNSVYVVHAQGMMIDGMDVKTE